MVGHFQAVADNARHRWPERGAAWIDALPAELDEFCRDLHVTPTGRTFGARFAHVVEATSRTGARLVLRASPDPDAVHQAAVLEQLARADLAPAVHLIRHSPTATWTAMDAVQPGTSLADGEVSESHRGSALVLLRTLGAERDGPPSVPSIIPWLRTRLTDPPADDQPPHRGPEPDQVRRAAMVVLDQLAHDTPAALCHGDLSPPNVLRGRSRLWLIDPRGMNGEPSYDIAVIALKTCKDDLERARRFAESLARASNNDPERSVAWTVVVNAATV